VGASVVLEKEKTKLRLSGCRPISWEAFEGSGQHPGAVSGKSFGVDQLWLRRARWTLAAPVTGSCASGLRLKAGSRRKWLGPRAQGIELRWTAPGGGATFCRYSG